jgi:hypothetical protein
MGGSAVLNSPNALVSPLIRPLANQSLRWSQRRALPAVNAPSSCLLARSFRALRYLGRWPLYLYVSPRKKTAEPKYN